MSCAACEEHDRFVKQAEGAISFAAKKLKSLHLMTYSQVQQFEAETAPLRQALITAKSNRTRHRNKCGGA